MKLNINSVCLALIICLSITNVFGQQKPYTITATIKGLPDGTKMELIPGATHKDEKPVAEAVVAKGQFAFKGALAEPRLFYIKTANAYGSYTIMVQEGHVTLSGNAKLSGNGENQRYSFDNMIVKGSAAHALYLQKRAPREQLDSIFNANDKANRVIQDKLAAAHKSKDSVLLKSLKESEAYKKMAASEGAFFALAGKTISKIISDNKETWWGPFLALNFYNYFRPDDKPMYAMFSQQAKDSYYGKILKEELDPEGFKGKKAPLLDIKGEGNTDMASLLKDHKYVLVDFWASWCNPCRKSIPHLKKAYAELNGKGLQIVSISIDKKEADWVKAQFEEQLPWPSFLDKGTTANAWKVRAIPTMFLLDSKGTVVGEGLSLDELLAKLKAD